MSLETYPLDAFLAAALRGFDQTQMPYLGIHPHLVTAADLAQILSFDCEDHIWDWPLRHLGLRGSCVLHDLTPFQGNEPEARGDQTRYFIRLGRVVDLADTLICASHATANDLIQLFPEARGKVRSITTGGGGVVSPGRDSPRPPSTGTTVIPNAVTVVVISSSEIQKNFEIVLAAAKRLVAGLAPRKLRLVFVGDIVGPDRVGENPFAELLQQAHKVASVAFTGRIVHSKALDWLSAADLFVEPSLRDSCSLPILEAMAVGIPVLASDGAYHRELGGQFIRYFVPYDIDDFVAKAMDCFAARPQLRERELRLAQQRAARFTWRRAAGELEQILTAEELVHQKPSAAVTAQQRPNLSRDDGAASPGRLRDVFVFRLSEVIGNQGLVAKALRELLRERAQDSSARVAVVIGVGDRELDSLHGRGSGEIDPQCREEVSRRVQSILAGIAPMPVKVLAVGQAASIGPARLEGLRGLESLLVSRIDPAGVQGPSGRYGALPDGVVESQCVYAADARVIAALPSENLRFERTMLVISDGVFGAAGSASAAPLQAIDEDRVRALLMPALEPALWVRECLRSIWVHGGLAATLAFLEDPRGDLECATAAACKEQLLESCPQLDTEFSLVVVVTEAADLTEIRMAITRIKARSGPEASREIVVLWAGREEQHAPTTTGLIALRDPDARKLLLSLARVVVSKFVDGTAVADEVCSAALLGAQTILVSQDIEPWICRILGSEAYPTFQTAIWAGLSRAKERLDVHRGALFYPQGWQMLLRVLQTYVQSGLLPTGDLSAVKRRLREPEMQRWGWRLCRENLALAEWERFTAALSAYPEQARSQKFLGLTFRNRIVNVIAGASAGMRPRRGSTAREIAAADRARDRGNWRSARDHYRRALELNPRQAAIWVQLGHALKETHDLDAAEEAYHKALLLDDRAGDTYLQLGHLLKLQGRRSEAKNAYLKALMRDQHLRPARQELAGLGYSQDEIERAVTARAF